MLKKTIAMLLVIAISAALITGCFDAREIDDEVYAISVGVDKGISSKVRLTIQYPTYKSGGGSESKKGSTGAEKSNEQSGSNVQTIEAPTMLEAIDMFSTATSRRVSLMHAKWVIFSEEFAKQGIDGYIAGLERYKETRTSMSILVTRGTAEDFIKENQSNIGESLSKSIELLLAQSNYTGFFPNVKFLDFYTALFSPYKCPIALYGGANNFEPKTGTTDGSSQIVSRKGLLPGELQRSGVDKRELAGLAVFNGGKMAGYMDAYETASYLMIIGEYSGGKISIPDKYSPEDAIVFDVHKSRNPKVKAYFKDGKPVIDLNIKLEAEVYVIQSRVDYEHLALADELESQIEEYVLEGIKHTIKKSQKELKTDIFGFGYWMAGNFFTIEDWESYNWLSHYPEAIVNVTLDVKIRRTGLIFHSSPIFSNTGKGDGQNIK